MNDRSTRSLVNLQQSASTARTLNLLDVWTRHRDHPEFRAKPFFKSPVLNRSIIVKHRLRSDEVGAFSGLCTQATKVILPIDPTDLRLGAHSFFVGQRGYADFMREVSSVQGEIDGDDDALLQMLVDLPSLDPFLMRERMRRVGRNPASFYYDLTEADTRRIFQFVRKELTPLIDMSYQGGGTDGRAFEKTGKLAGKILANAADEELEPLRLSLGMEPADFQESVFCWKGFIYYKWTLGDLLPKIRPVADEIAAIGPSGPATFDEKMYIVQARASLVAAIGRACDTVRATLKIYDDAYADLTKHGQPQGFRNFLMRAPSMFHELGERLGGVHHIVSFWRYRFPEGRRPKIAVEELMDLLNDFETSLTFSRASTAVELAA